MIGTHAPKTNIIKFPLRPENPMQRVYYDTAIRLFERDQLTEPKKSKIKGWFGRVKDTVTSFSVQLKVPTGEYREFNGNRYEIRHEETIKITHSEKNNFSIDRSVVGIDREKGVNAYNLSAETVIARLGAFKRECDKLCRHLERQKQQLQNPTVWKPQSDMPGLL
jgi:hypothetical protein